MEKQRVMVQIMDKDNGDTYNVPRAWLTWSKRCQKAYARCSDQNWFNLLDRMPKDYPKDEGATEELYWLIMDTDNYTIVN